MYICGKCLKRMIVEKIISIENFDDTNETMNGYVLWCKECDIRIINGWSMLEKLRMETFPEMLDRRQKDERDNFS